MIHIETSDTIAQWAEKAFGSVAELTVLVRRAELELAELMEAGATGAPAEEIRAEAADVAILLHRLVALSGGDLCAAVDAKMAINRKRAWTPTGDGTGRHNSPSTKEDVT